MNDKVSDAVSTTYALKRVGKEEYRHADPVRGEWWGPLNGAFTFTTVEEAIKYGVYFTGGEAFQVIPVDTPARG